MSKFFSRTIGISIFVFIAIQFSSCYISKTTIKETFKYEYQLTYFESNDLDSNFTYSDENIQITYSIKNLEYKFEIENLSNRAIYLDVAKSSLIVNKVALNYLKTLDTKERFYYIPSKSVYPLDFSNEIPKRVTDNEFTMEGLKEEFNETNTILSLRNQITYGFDEQFSESRLVENHIWIKKFGKCDQLLFNEVKNLRSKKIAAEMKMKVLKNPVTVREYSKKRTAALVIPLVSFFTLAVTLTIGLILSNNN